MAEKIIRRSPGKEAVVLALQGKLGSGKTTFAQGFLRGLGRKQRAVSPTFVIMKRFSIEDKNFRNFYHVDVYRLKKFKELRNWGFGEIAKNPRNVVLIEWADKVRALIPKSAVRLRFEHGRKENERIIKINEQRPLRICEFVNS